MKNMKKAIAALIAVAAVLLSSCVFVPFYETDIDVRVEIGDVTLDVPTNKVKIDFIAYNAGEFDLDDVHVRFKVYQDSTDVNSAFDYMTTTEGFSLFIDETRPFTTSDTSFSFGFIGPNTTVELVGVAMDNPEDDDSEYLSSY